VPKCILRHVENYIKLEKYVFGFWGGMFLELLSSMVLEQDRTEKKRVPSEAKK
jgi:hypothetical protein